MKKLPLFGRFRDSAWSLIFLIISAALFAFSAENINLRGMTDLGIIVVLPPAIVFSLLLLTFSFIFTLHRSESQTGLLLMHVVLIIFILHGITVPAEEVPRFNVTWRHVGLIDDILRNQSVTKPADAYLNWPGFFILSAFVMEITGLKNPIQLAFWPSVFNNLLYLGPLFLILRSISEDRKIVWYGLWLFYIGNWVGQDYFAPQALNYFLYTAILGILLWSFKSTQPASWLAVFNKFQNKYLDKILQHFVQTPEAQVPGRAAQDVEVARRRRLIGLFVILFAVLFSAASHQLTPYAILFTVFVLAFFKQISARDLGYIVVIIVLVWVAYMAVPFMKHRAQALLDDVGQVDQALSANISARLHGSPGHELIVRVRILETLFIWGLAFLSMFRSFLKKQLDFVPVILALSPFALVLLQFYGGEMLLRVSFFTLPFMAFFIANLVYKDFPQAHIRWQPWLAGLISLILIGTFFLSRYGNEKIDQFTAKEVEAINYLYKIAEPEALLAAPSPHYPIKFKGYDLYKVRFYPDPVYGNDVNALITALDQANARATFFTITSSQVSYFQIFYDVSPALWPDFEAQLLASGRFELIYANDDAKIYKLLEK